MKLKIRRPIKNSDSSGRTHQLMTRANVLGISLQSFLLLLFSRTDQVPPSTTVNIYFLFNCLFLLCWWLCNHKPFVNNYLLEVSIDDVLSQVFIIIHKYIHIYMHILPYTQTHTLSHITFCLQYTIIVIYWNLVLKSLVYNTLTLKYRIRREMCCHVNRKK